MDATQWLYAFLDGTHYILSGQRHHDRVNLNIAFDPVISSAGTIIQPIKSIM